MRAKHLILILLVALSAHAQMPEKIKASVEKHKGDFDYLLGDWQFTIHNWRGTAHGFWSAVRLADGQIYDEYRIVGDKGETLYLTSTIRAYNAILDRWELISMGDVNGLQDFGTGHVENGEMHIEQKFGVGGPHPDILRIRYHDIQADRFLWNADRSDDDGKTWVKDAITIEAHRIGPAKTMPALTPPKQH
jgi:hypothetical protein